MQPQVSIWIRLRPWSDSCAWLLETLRKSCKESGCGVDLIAQAVGCGLTAQGQFTSLKPGPQNSQDKVQSVQFSRSVVSDSLRCHGLQHTPSTHQASLSITNSWSLLKLMSIESVMPSSLSSSVVPFSSCPQSFPASGSFQMSQFFASGDL